IDQSATAGTAPERPSAQVLSLRFNPAEVRSWPSGKVDELNRAGVGQVALVAVLVCFMEGLVVGFLMAGTARRSVVWASPRTSLAGPRAWLKDHHRGLGRPERRIGVQLRVDPSPSAPQARPLVPLATRALTERGPSTRSTLASGCAWRFSHQAGSPSAQLFIAIAMRFGPSAKLAMVTLCLRPVRRPVGVRRRVPQRLPLGRHSPTRPPVTRYRARCTDHARRMTSAGE